MAGRATVGGKHAALFRAALEERVDYGKLADGLIALCRSRDPRVQLRATEAIVRIIGADPVKGDRVTGAGEAGNGAKLNLRSVLSGGEVLDDPDGDWAEVEGALSERRTRRKGALSDDA